MICVNLVRTLRTKLYGVVIKKIRTLVFFKNTYKKKQIFLFFFSSLSSSVFFFYKGIKKDHAIFFNFHFPWNLNMMWIILYELRIWNIFKNIYYTFCKYIYIFNYDMIWNFRYKQKTAHLIFSLLKIKK